MDKIQFVGTYEGRSKNVGSLRCVNLFPAIVDRGQQVVLYGTPGLVDFADIDPRPVRGSYVYGDSLLVVCHRRLYSLDSSGTSTFISNIILDTTGPVYFTSDTVNVTITDGTYGYTYNPTLRTLVKITDPDFPLSVTSCTFLNGRTLVTQATSSNIYASDAYGSTSWNALNFGVAQASNDYVVRIVALFASMFVFGTQSLEIWVGAGISGFPFEVNPSMTIATGCAASKSVVVSGDTGNSLIWLAQTREGNVFVVRSDGGLPTAISTPEIEFEWGTYSIISDAIAYAYRSEGHTFYVLTFPTADKTWVYDTVVNTWHERSSGLFGGRHISNCYAFFAGKHIVGDYRSGKLYIMDDDVYSDDGEPIIRTLVMPHLGADDTKTSYGKLLINMETGLGGLNPEESQIMMSMSNDHGHTYGNEHWGTIGANGAYNTRVFWNRLGAAFFRTFKITISSACKIVIKYAGVSVS